MRPHLQQRTARIAAIAAAALILSMRAGAALAAPPDAGAAAAPGAPSPAPLPPTLQRDPFELTPQLQAGSGLAGLGFVQLLRSPGMPAIKLKALIDSPTGRVALVDVQGVGQYRVREGENIQLSPQMGMRVQRIGREELVLTPMDVRSGFNQLIIK